MLRVSDRAGPARACHDALDSVAFRKMDDVGTPDVGDFAAQYLAYMLPCQRFACALTDADA